ncbi:MAG TPA: carboxypeptidase-like regulatory domain-containing protein [Pyrinomonadaceae bacterium]|nr:carboxypeptidase-like regulatory domain-containing protein [Pyrinomonadaceae bacterium]
MNVRTSTALSRLALVCGVLVAWPAFAPAALAQEGRAPAAARPARGARGSISGRVVGEGGEPLAQVTVFVTPRGSVRQPSRPRVVVSDDGGNFVAPGLEPGVYHVGVSAPGYVPDPEQLSAVEAYRPGDFVVMRMLRGGVVTGVVTDAAGAPLAALSVRAFRVRDHEGRPAASSWNFSNEDQTDDRGVYRIYGLPPGTYVVAAGGGAQRWGYVSPYDGNAPTFYPSGTRDTAAEVSVRAGQETAGVDIRYRDERGHRVTGTLAPTGAAAAGEPGEGASVVLNYAGSGVPAAHAWVGAQDVNRSFSFEGVADGDYEVLASMQTRDGVSASSASQRVSVRGADVTGLRLTLAPLASVSGTVSAEAAPEAVRALAECKGRAAAPLLQETLVIARGDPKAAGTPAQPPRRGPQVREASPDEAGEFTLRHLEAGAYRLGARPLDENFYVRSIQPPPAAGRAAAGAMLQVVGGQRLAGLSIRLAAGAASAAGSVAAEPGAPPFAALRVYLVPAERERAEDTLRYAEATPTPAGSFAFRNLAPGRYLLVVRATDAAEARPRPPFWDADARAALRREAAAAGLTLDLQPCQRAADLTLRYPVSKEKP